MTPEASKLTTVQQQVTADDTTVTQLNLELIALKAPKKLVLKELPYLKKVTTAIPPTEDPPGIVDSLNTLREQHGLRSVVGHAGELPEPQWCRRPLSHSSHVFDLRTAQKCVRILDGFLLHETVDDNQ